jgi:hypothetical protein
MMAILGYTFFDTQRGDVLFDAAKISNLLSAAVSKVAGAFAAITGTTLTLTGNATVNGVVEPVTTGIVAGTTHSLVGATALPSPINVIATVANASDAVALPSVSVGQRVTVFNAAATNAAAVWPAAAASIDGGTAGAAVSLAAGAKATYVYVATNTWYSIAGA